MENAVKISELQRNAPSGFATKLIDNMKQQAATEASRMLAKWHQARATDPTVPHPADQILADISRMLHVSR
jgi:hypothetical protein